MPTSVRNARAAPIYVSIVANNRATLDGLRAYLGGAGVPCHGTRAIGDVATVAPPCATAAVVFPDDFAEGEVVTLVHVLRRARPRLLVLLVTREPQRFRAAVEADGRSLPPLVLPKPSFGWDILDAIRAHAVDAEERSR